MSSPTDSFIVRPSTAGDALGALEAVRRSIAELCVEDHQNDAATLAQWLENKTPERFERWRLDPGNWLVVAEAGAVICGVALVARTGDIRICYVLPGCHGSGVGRALFRALEGQARQWGLGELRLNSTGTARGFCERQGCISSGEPVPGFGITRGYPYRKRLSP